jgi:hypothetical protein
MEIKNRQKTLVIVTATIVGLLIANSVIYAPLKDLWDARNKRIKTLQDSVEADKSLIRRKTHLQARWEHMKKNVLPGNPSLAGSTILKAKDRWESRSGIKVESFSPQMQAIDDPDTRDVITTLSCRADASGSMRNLLGFLYEVESDPMGLKLEDVDITTKDNNGQQLALGLTMSGLVLDLPQPDAPVNASTNAAAPSQQP